MPSPPPAPLELFFPVPFSPDFLSTFPCFPLNVFVSFYSFLPLLLLLHLLPSPFLLFKWLNGLNEWPGFPEGPFTQPGMQ